MTMRGSSLSIIDAETLIQFGFAGIALLMMYNITYNHLARIQTTLTEIKTILEKIYAVEPLD